MRRALRLRTVALLAAAAAATASVGCHTSPLTAASTSAWRTVRMANPAGEPEALTVARASTPPIDIQLPPPRQKEKPPEPPRPLPAWVASSPPPAPSTPPAPPTVIGPETTLLWVAEPTRGQDRKGIDGKGSVDKDGNLNLGPYGSVHVSGLSPQQASKVMAQHLARWMQTPRVKLTAANRPLRGDAVARGTGPGAKGVLGVVTWEPSPTPEEPPSGVVNAYAPEAVADSSDGPSLLASDSAERKSSDSSDDSSSKDSKDSSDGDKDNGSSGNDKDKENGKGNANTTAPAAPAFVPGFWPGDCDPHHAPKELSKMPLPPYVIEPPDILLVEVSRTLRDQPVRGQHLVRPDGTIGLGIYGSVFVGGLTIDQARAVITAKLGERIKNLEVREVSVDVLAYNSKVYYVITDGAGYGEQVYRFPVTGSETVLDALGQINGLPPVADKKRIWVARRLHDEHGHGQVLPVDWIGITQHGSTATNYQLMPGDRVYVKADCWRTADTYIAKVLSPIERLLGVTLLGATTVNAIKGNVGGGGNGGGNIR